MRHKTAADLTPQQDAFAREYVLNGDNGALAYRKAFPRTRGSKARTVSKHASRLLALPKIMARIEHYRAQVRAKVDSEFDVEAGLVLRELTAIAFIDVRDLATWGYERVPVLHRGKPVEIGGVPLYRNQPFLRLKPSDQLSRDAARAIQKIEKTIGHGGIPLVNFVLASKERALVALAKHCGLIETRVHHSGRVETGPVVVMASPQERDA